MADRNEATTLPQVADTGRVAWEHDGAVRILTLDRPARRNAFTVSLYRELTAALRQADDDESVRVVVLTGAGPAFCAGTDLDELAAIATGAAPDGAGTAFPGLLDALTEVSVPLVAAVNGPGVGLGATMLPYFDLVFMADTARLRAPFAAMGVPPEAASSALFPLRMGWLRAARALLAAAWMSADEALAGGLVTAISPAERVLADAVAAAQEIAAHERAATRSIKSLMRAAERDLIAATRAREDDAYRRLFRPEERP
ncbi:MAG TPA: enoyl-CoA hydratase/isomerase family protein [Acidimicrobiales bacterium]|nr:enoyl-CoA hydratase/isomerase family protein [Acidimicrobiales bacterium]